MNVRPPKELQHAQRVFLVAREAIPLLLAATKDPRLTVALAFETGELADLWQAAVERFGGFEP